MTIDDIAEGLRVVAMEVDRATVIDDVHYPHQGLGDDKTAPAVRQAAERFLALARARAVPVAIYETWRSDARQRWLYASGRTRPGPIVTYARSAFDEWHGYGLALDVIHASLAWNAPTSFWNDVGRLAKECGFDWGGDWKRPDLPHLQWGKCRASPSWRATALLSAGGPEAVWRAVGALDVDGN